MNATLEQVACAYDELEAQFPETMEIANLKARRKAITEHIYYNQVPEGECEELERELGEIQKKLEELGE